MKILFFISGMSAGGAQRSLLTLCEGLQEHKEHTIYVATWINKDDKYIIPKSINLIDLGTANRRCSSRISYIRSIFDIRKTIKKVSPDIVVAVQCNMYPRVLLANCFCKSKLIVWEHTSMSRKMDFEASISRKYLYRFSDGLFVLTNKDKLIAKNLASNIEVMPNPLPFPTFTELCTRINNVVAIGRLDVWHIKGFDTLIDIWAKLRDYHKDWKLMVVGEGSVQNTQFLKNLIDKRGLSDSILLTGYRNDVQDILKNSKIYVLPSRVEGFPMGLIEAMSQGCACVSFSIDNSVRDIISDKQDGFIICDRNEEEFAQKLSLLMDNDSLLQDISCNATKNINRFNKSIIANKWIETLNKIL